MHNNKKFIRLVFLHPWLFLSFGFGSGLLPKAPGTFGTLTAIPIFIILSSLSLWLYLLTCLLMCLLGIYLCGFAAKKLDSHDYPGIVWDEICGFLLAMTGFAASWQNILLGFILFRIFDIVKPWPIKWVEQKFSGGLGIMLDDLLAGILTWCSLCLIDLWLVNLPLNF